MGDYPGLSRWAPCPLTSSLYERNRRVRIREGDAKTETQVRVIQGHRPRHVGGLSEAGKGKETDYSLEPLKKCSLANPF